MKMKQLYIFVFSFVLFGCKNNSSESKPTSTSDEEIIQHKQHQDFSNSSEKNDSEVIQDKTISRLHRPKSPEILYVQARSGLNYRITPKGNIIDKFYLNEALEIVEHTKEFDSVKEAGKWIKGEWLGVKKELDTVYVFGGFLENSFVHSNINIFYIHEYGNNGKEYAGDFVNLSEGFLENSYDHQTGEQKEISVIPEENLGKDYFDLSSKNRKKFLQQMKISETDSVFIYSFSKDSITRLPVKSLKVMANLNIYAKGDEHVSTYDYELGFKLEDYKSGDGEYFVFVGERNIFQTGSLRSIIWEVMKTDDFPVTFNAEMIHYSIRNWFKDMRSGKSYRFSNGNLNYFLQDLIHDGTIHRYLVVIDTTTENVVYKDIFMDTESTSSMPLNIKGQETEYYQTQWTGTIFKNKPAIVYGFLSNSFGCPDIRFLSNSEPTIYIRCDNRH